MTYKIVVADDEYYIRKKLIKVIDYDGLNLELAADFESGQGVLDFFTQNRADIVLLDIQMPKVSGLDTAQFLFRNFPDTKIIILSGFNDFEYAQATLRCNVFDYLLKPVDAEALNDTLSRCLSVIKERNQEKNRLDNLMHYEKSTQLHRVLRGKKTYQTLKAAHPELINIKYTMFYTFFVDTDCGQSARELSSLFRRQNIECEYFIESDHVFYIQFFLEEDVLEPLCRYHCKKFFLAYETSCFYYFGELFDVEEPWNTSLKRSFNRLDFRFFSKSSDLSAASSSVKADTEDFYIDSIRQPLMRLLNASNAKEFETYINSIFYNIEHKKSVDYLHLVVMEIFGTFSIKYSSLKNYHPIPRDFAKSIMSEEYLLEEIKGIIIRYGLNYMRNSDAVPSDIRLSQNIIHYLMEHYQDPTMTVSSLAFQFKLNVSYMGSVFKKVNNTSILQFLTTLRMTEAKNLLKTKQYKVAEIAEMVGYTDVFYFSRRFKTFCGCTPKEFMQQ
jgi:two-component system response regulator YesN